MNLKARIADLLSTGEKLQDENDHGTMQASVLAQLEWAEATTIAAEATTIAAEATTSAASATSVAQSAMHVAPSVYTVAPEASDAPPTANAPGRDRH